MERAHPLSKKYQVKEIAGENYIFIVVSDLNDDLLLQHLEKGLEEEDFEYCEAIAAEAQLRGISIKQSIVEFLNQK
jgi:hypothetical protein